MKKEKEKGRKIKGGREGREEEIESYIKSS